MAVILPCSMYDEGLWVNDANSIGATEVNWNWGLNRNRAKSFFNEYIGYDKNPQATDNYTLFSVPLEVLPKALNYSLSGWTTDGNIDK